LLNLDRNNTDVIYTEYITMDIYYTQGADMPTKLDENEKLDLTKALGVWAKRNNVRPIDFMHAMGWSYNYTWRVLRNRDRFVPAAFGDFVLAYGVKALLSLFEIAGVDPEPK
jgi:hypothetical protein